MFESNKKSFILSFFIFFQVLLYHLLPSIKVCVLPVGSCIEI
jgi:hypothetical protein